LLNMKKYGKLLLSAYIMEKIKSGKSQKGGGMISKYSKLFLLGYILKKLSFKTIKSVESYKEAEPEKVELNKAGKGSGMKKLGKIVLAALVGAIAIYAFKKYATKKSEYKIAVQ
jgi:hypothetical protein